MSSTACCFCRRLASTDEIEAGLWICPNCAAHTTAYFHIDSSERSGAVEMIRSIGRSSIVKVQTYTNWGSGLSDTLKTHVAKLNRYLREIAQS